MLTARRLRIHRWSAADHRRPQWGTFGLPTDLSTSLNNMWEAYRDNGDPLLSVTEQKLGRGSFHVLCRPALGTRYDIDASFSNADADDMMTATINVYVDGQRQVTRSIRSVAMTFKRINVYNYDNGEASIGGIEVEYDVGAQPQRGLF